SIAYTDAYNRLFIVGSPSPANQDSIWKIGRERSLNMIKEHPLLGVGPDVMARIQSADKTLMTDSIDRSYNEYLYIAATRGLPSLIAYLALLLATLWRLFKGVKEFASDKEKWFRPALLTAVLAYSVQAFFSASAVTVAPFFWLMMGIAWSNFTDETRKAKNSSAKK
ncbi:MAG: O-antigen ligase family protein, partial [Oscillospiraceae bacterium]|nr:O-antigen ligase family protein [Oscillospiraceae bacterium]